MPEVPAYNPENGSELSSAEPEVQESEDQPEVASADFVPDVETVETENSPDYQKLEAKFIKATDKANRALANAIGAVAVGVVSGMAAFPPGVAVSVFFSSRAGREYRRTKSEADSLREVLETQKQKDTDEAKELSVLNKEKETKEKIAQFVDDCCTPGSREAYKIEIGPDGTTKLELKNYMDGPIRVERPFSETETIPPEITVMGSLKIGDDIHEFHAPHLKKVSELKGGESLDIADLPSLEGTATLDLKGSTAINCPNLSSVGTLRIPNFRFSESRFGALKKLRSVQGINGFKASFLTVALDSFSMGNLPERVKTYLNSLGKPSDVSISRVSSDSTLADRGLSAAESEEKTEIS